jgi:hypothetical protein
MVLSKTLPVDFRMNGQPHQPQNFFYLSPYIDNEVRPFENVFNLILFSICQEV